MSAIKKRKLNGNTPSIASSVPEHKSTKKSTVSKKLLSKPAPQADLTPESSTDEDEEFESFDGNEEPERDGKNSGEGVRRTFADLGVREELCEACSNLKFTHPTPIQEQSIPLALQGRDVIGLAETGSGKTAAFVLPILQALMEKPQALFGLVLAPTRELAYQIAQQVEALGSIINVKCATLVGGMDMVSQAIALSKRPHIVVATPGRLLDHLENTKGFSLKHLKYLVMDEADRLLDLDFGPVSRGRPVIANESDY